MFTGREREVVSVDQIKELRDLDAHIETIEHYMVEMYHLRREMRGALNLRPTPRIRKRTQVVSIAVNE